MVVTVMATVAKVMAVTMMVVTAEMAIIQSVNGSDKLRIFVHEARTTVLKE
jgi:hypothetical protein